MIFPYFGGTPTSMPNFALVVQILSATVVMAILLWAILTINRSSDSYPKRKPPIQITDLPSMTIVLPTWNESKVIEGKLKDIRSQEYPDELLEIIVIDSSSNDETVPLAKEWISSEGSGDGRQYRIIEEETRSGKSVSINRAFEEAREQSTILMMSDADCRLSDGTLLEIAKFFQDEEIGAVTGRQILLNSDQSIKTQQEGSYRDFFTKMRVAESNIHSTPIFHGECAAYRRSAISNHKLVENSNADDSQMAVSAVRSGFRSVYEPSIEFFEMAPPNGRSSRIQKVRRAQGLVRHFWRNRDLALSRNSPIRGIMALEFCLHIIMPIFVTIGFLSGIIHLGSIANIIELNFGGIQKLPTADLVMVFLDILVVILISSGILGLPIPGSRLSYTFFIYMLTIMRAISMIIAGKSLHIWDQVPSVRDELSHHDSREQA